MTVFYLESTAPVTSMPRARDFQLLRSRLSDGEFDAALAHINGLIAGDEIHTSSWMPGSDWTGTPLEAVYAKAAARNHELSAKYFGLLTFYAFMRHPQEWITGRFEMNGDPLPGRTYFRKRY